MNFKKKIREISKKSEIERDIPFSKECALILGFNCTFFFTNNNSEYVDTVVFILMKGLGFALKHGLRPNPTPSSRPLNRRGILCKACC